MKKLLFIATDVKHDCLRCYYNGKTCNIGDKLICEKIAEDLDIFSVYATELKEPKIEYTGG